MSLPLIILWFLIGSTDRSLKPQLLRFSRSLSNAAWTADKHIALIIAKLTEFCVARTFDFTTFTCFTSLVYNICICIIISLPCLTSHMDWLTDWQLATFQQSLSLPDTRFHCFKFSYKVSPIAKLPFQYSAWLYMVLGKNERNDVKDELYLS